MNQKSRLAYILLGLFLGGLGIHNFYAGYIGRGIAQIILMVLGFVTFGLTTLALMIWIIVEFCTVKQDAKGIKFR